MTRMGWDGMEGGISAGALVGAPGGSKWKRSFPGKWSKWDRYVRLQCRVAKF